MPESGKDWMHPADYLLPVSVHSIPVSVRHRTARVEREVLTPFYLCNVSSKAEWDAFDPSSSEIP